MEPCGLDGTRVTDERWTTRSPAAWITSASFAPKTKVTKTAVAELGPGGFRPSLIAE